MQSPSWAPGMCGAGPPPAGLTARASPCTSTPTSAIACPTGQRSAVRLHPGVHRGAAGRGPGVLLLWRRRHLPCGHLSGRRGLHPRHLQRRGQDQLFRWLLQQHLCGCGADPGRLTTLYSLIPPLLLRAAVRRCAENYFFCRISPNPFAVFSLLCTIERQNRLFWRWRVDLSAISPYNEGTDDFFT